jgi:glycosyltransferase involved in cell wall biosynthesis
MMTAGNNDSTKKPVVLICCDWYAPGYKAGGPVQSVIHLSQAIAGTTEVYVLTSDRDLNEIETYEGIRTDLWLNGKDGVNVMYVSPQKQRLSWYKEIMQDIKPDVLHVNSMWSVKFTILPLLAASHRKNTRVILSPRGMLNEGSFRFKRLKKIFGLSVLRFFGLLKGVTFHATDEGEKLEIQQKIPAADVVLIPNLAGQIRTELIPVTKKKGELKLVYIGRIAPQKNVHFILDLLKDIPENFNITFSLIGLEDDVSYGQVCRKAAESLPPHIAVSFVGPLPHEHIHKKLLENHFLIQTSFSENFGHSVFEALSSGRPVIISDGMPWKHLAEARAGYDIPLSNKISFLQALADAADMDQSTYDQCCHGALDYAISAMNFKKLQKEYIQLYTFLKSS